MNLTKHGYIKVNNKALEDTVGEIREGGIFKERFRQTFEVNALLMIEKRFNSKTRYSKNEKLVPIRFWSANTQKMAKTMVEIILKEIEKGNFDIYDDKGDRILKGDGKPKIKNLFGVIRKRMEYIFIDLINGQMLPYKKYFDKDIPFEQEFLNHFDEADKSELDTYYPEKLEAIKRKQKKALKKINTASNFYKWLKDNSPEYENEIDSKLFNDLDPDKFKVKFINCFKQLTATEKNYTAVLSIGFLLKDVAEMFDVSSPAVSRCVKKAREKLYECLYNKNISEKNST